MLKATKIVNQHTIHQIQLGYFSVQMDYHDPLNGRKYERTLLASNIYVIEYDQEIWIFDTGFSAKIEIPYIQPRLKYSFSDVIKKYQLHHHVNIILSHCHPDHIGGLIECFNDVTRLNWRVFVNKSHLQPAFYSEFPLVQSFIETSLKPYPFLFDLKYCAFVKPLFIGGHTPEHTVLQCKTLNLVYPADIIPTAYHLTHLPFGERNYNEERFKEIREETLNYIRQKGSLILFPHAPNDGILKLS